MRLEVVIPTQELSPEYRLAFMDKETGEPVFRLTSGFDALYSADQVHVIAQAFMHLCCDHPLRFQHANCWFMLGPNGQFHSSGNLTEELEHVLLHAAFLLYDCQYFNV